MRTLVRFWGKSLILLGVSSPLLLTNAQYEEEGIIVTWVWKKMRGPRKWSGIAEVTHLFNRKIKDKCSVFLILCPKWCSPARADRMSSARNPTLFWGLYYIISMLKMKFQTSNAFSLTVILVITFKIKYFSKFISDAQMTHHQTSSLKSFLPL